MHRLTCYSITSILLLFLLSWPLEKAIAQPITDPEGDVVIGGATADPSAILDLQSTTKGLLMPRMTEAQRDAISNPATGLIFYNTDSNAFQVNTGTGTNPTWETILTDKEIGNFAWRLGGNIAPASSIFGTLDATDIDVRTDSITAMIISGTDQSVAVSNDLIVNGNTSLGDDASADKTTIAGETRITESDAGIGLFVDESNGGVGLRVIERGGGHGIQISENGGGDGIVVNASGAGIGISVVSGDVDLADNFNVDGSSTLNGHVNLGDGSGDNVVIDVTGGSLTTTGLPALSTATELLVSNAGVIETRAASSLITPISLVIDSTLMGDGTAGTPLGVNLASANTWTATQTISDANLIIANSVNSSGKILFAEPSGSGTNVTTFEAGIQTADIRYILPLTTTATSTPEDGLLQLDGTTGQLSWVDPGDVGSNAWELTGNVGTTPGTDFLGTTDGQAMHIYVNGGDSNSLILNTNGSIQRDMGGNVRGINALDLQIDRSGLTQVASGDYATLGGGRDNEVSGDYSTIPGGRGLTLSGDNSLGFLGANSGANDMAISASDVAVLGNTDLWLANNDSTASQIRFYEVENDSGAFPGTGASEAYYTSFEAPPLSDTIEYILPATKPTSTYSFLYVSDISGDRITLDWTTLEFEIPQSISPPTPTLSPRSNNMLLRKIESLEAELSELRELIQRDKQREQIPDLSNLLHTEE